MQQIRFEILCELLPQACFCSEIFERQYDRVGENFPTPRRSIHFSSTLKKRRGIGPSINFRFCSNLMLMNG